MLKKIISILLAIFMTLSITTVAFSATSDAEEESPVLIDISTNRNSYSTLGIAKVTVKVKNSGTEPIDNVSVETVFSGLSPIGKNSKIKCESDSLPAGGELSYSFKCIVNNNNLSVFQRIIQTFITLFSKRLTVSEAGFNDGRSYISADKTIKFGSYQATIGVNVYAGNNGKEFNDFYTDKIDVLVGKTESVTFFADISSQTVVDKVSVYDENNSFVGDLYDDGNHNDGQAYDGLFANKLELNSSDVNYIGYYAKFANQTSARTYVNFYRKFTSNEIDSQTTVINGVKQIVSQYVETENEEENYINSQKSYNEILIFLESQKALNNVMRYEIVDSVGIHAVLAGNIDYYINFEDLICKTNRNAISVKSRNEKALYANNNSTNTTRKIITLEPYDELHDQVYDNSARNVANSGNGFSFTRDANNTAADVNQFKHLNDYAIVIINSHGGNWGGNIGNIICTGEEATPERIQSYNADLSGPGQRMGVSSSGNFAVGWHFFNDYYNSPTKHFNNTLFYIDSCHGADNDELPNSLIKNGASAVCAYRNSVYCDYSYSMCGTIFDELCKLNTISSAVNSAKTKHGSTDPTKTQWYYLWWKEQNPAELRLIGNESYKLRMSEIAGTVLDAETNQRIPNAKVSVKKTLFSIGSQQSDSNGDYSITVNPGTYSVTISAYGYISRTIDNVVVEPDQTTYLSASTLIKSGDGKGIVGGKLINSINGNPVANATIKFRNKHGILSGMYVLNGITPLTITTNENGEFYCDTLARGYYSLEASKEGFVTESTDVIAGTNTTNQRATITPELPEGQYRIVLTWGAYPSDLDSHLTGKTSSGSPFHVYFSNKDAWDGETNVANLDVDDTSSYGPETITLNPTTTDTYKYYVYNYSGNGSASISTSFAQIKLYKGNALIATYNAPTDQGTDRYWTVFEITNGTVKNINKIASSVQ